MIQKWILFCIVAIQVMAIAPKITAQSNVLPLYQPEENLMDNMDDSLPQAYRITLSRINYYRRAMGLPLWNYDPELSKMGNAHVNYCLINCKAKKSWRGHYEKPEYEGYTKEGDEAARGAGLSIGKDSLYALEILMAGPYHRLQFLNPKAMRVGISHGYDEVSNCSRGLFVNRPLDTTSPKQNHRFIYFPAHNMEDVPLAFITEWPDPRPLQNDKENQNKPSGYISSILLNPQDANNFQNISVTMTDSHGNIIDCWITHPKNPTWKTLPQDIEEVYSGFNKTTGKNPFIMNYNSVFIMPKKVLAPSETYTITGTMLINNEEIPVKWSFKTRKNHQFLVKPNPKNNSIHSLDFAINHSVPGDEILLDIGKHNINTIWFLSTKLKITGKNKEQTILYLAKKDKQDCLFRLKNSTLEISSLTYYGENGRFFNAEDHSNLTLNSINILNAVNGVGIVRNGSNVTLNMSLFQNIGRKGVNPFYVFPEDKDIKASKLFMNQNNTFIKINESFTFGGIGAETMPGRIWKITSTQEFIDALRVIPSGETIELYKGVIKLSENYWLDKKITINGSSKDSTKIIFNSKPNTYLFTLHKNADVIFNSLTIGDTGYFFYVKGLSQLKLNDVKINSSGKETAIVLGEECQLNIQKLDITHYFPILLISIKDKKAKYNIQKINQSNSKKTYIFKENKKELLKD